MMTSTAGRIAAVRIDIETRSRGTFRRRSALVRLAVAFLFTLAPMACKKEEVDADPATDGTVTEEPGHGEQTSQWTLPGTDPKVGPLSATLDGSWHALEDGGCSQADFDLTNRSSTDEGSATLYPAAGMPSRLHALYRLDDDGLAGVAQNGGPYRDCDAPKTMRFFVRPQRAGDSLEIRWQCTAKDGNLEYNKYIDYARGPCPGGKALVPERLIAEDDGAETPPDDGTETPPDIGTDAGTSADGEEMLTTTLHSDGTVTYGAEPAAGGRKPAQQCNIGETYRQYVASPEACARCEESCRQPCGQRNATLLGNCSLCEVAAEEDSCGDCLELCLSAERDR